VRAEGRARRTGEPAAGGSVAAAGPAGPAAGGAAGRIPITAVGSPVTTPRLWIAKAAPGGPSDRMRETEVSVDAVSRRL
jgi:hypothetical protein